MRTNEAISILLNDLMRERNGIAKSIDDAKETLDEISEQNIGEHNGQIILDIELPWLTGEHTYRNYRIKPANMPKTMETLRNAIQMDIDYQKRQLKEKDAKLCKILQGEV